MSKMIFTGRDGLALDASVLKTILSNRRYSVNFFGAPAPKFDSHESMKMWAEKQIGIHMGYIDQLNLLRTVAVGCMSETLSKEQCKDCDELIGKA